MNMDLFFPIKMETHTVRMAYGIVARRQAAATAGRPPSRRRPASSSRVLPSAALRCAVRRPHRRSQRYLKCHWTDCSRDAGAGNGGA